MTPDEPKLTVVPELAVCWMPQRRRWRAIKAHDVLAMGDPRQLYQVEWITHGDEWRSAGRPQAKVVGFKAFAVDLDAEVIVLVEAIERDAIANVREHSPEAIDIDCARHEHSQLDEGAA
jgi:hypothetical protein